MLEPNNWITDYLAPPFIPPPRLRDETGIRDEQRDLL